MLSAVEHRVLVVSFELLLAEARFPLVELLTLVSLKEPCQVVGLSYCAQKMEALLVRLAALPSAAERRVREMPARFVLVARHRLLGEGVQLL